MRGIDVKRGQGRVAEWDARRSSAMLRRRRSVPSPKLTKARQTDFARAATRSAYRPALSGHSPAGPTLQSSLPEPIIHSGRSILNGPMGVDVWDFRPVSLCEIDDRANGLPVNPLKAMKKALADACGISSCRTRAAMKIAVLLRLLEVSVRTFSDELEYFRSLLKSSAAGTILVKPSQGDVARQCEAVIGTAWTFMFSSPFWALELYGGRQ
ncbi:hypothetical protein JMK10_20135 [Rhodovulum sulfidophilum]|uniref:hypothetical protein n=1 Tax=Rhodovulum sulfidophilum TaxID=35806 RepID=UPI00192298D0|nr:hypothetical protein [Rhodovulum sulfidophilum]MBL3576181.1 hypothetical protein [Rhodovulum sulfidophilum]MCE8433468.1 hypothetical protein [Rhodovulum sulfidophilum]MCF4119009.1 hypothetical protein [Rhodovulum sulfidophilum]